MRGGVEIFILLLREIAETGKKIFFEEGVKCF